jgi:hypothetical protein
MNNKVLLIGPEYLHLYKDLMSGFEKLGYEVDFAKEYRIKNDPLDVRRERFRITFGSTNRKKKYWKLLLNKEQYDKAYDILFVLDGQGLHPELFDILKSRNQHIRCFNFLFDTVRGVYHFEKFFPYFDKVFTFDREESKKYQIKWIPIYWIPPVCTVKEEYDMFGFGSFSPDRFEVFQTLNDFSEKEGLNSYIKLKAQINREWFYALRRLVRKPLGLRLEISLKQYHSPLIIHNNMSPTDFRDMVYKSKIVIDTHPLHQDGLTARFMWALGARKKIITTNANIMNYGFYNPSQIFVTNNIKALDVMQLKNFIKEEIILTEKQSNEIDRCRIDKWLMEICS